MRLVARMFLWLIQVAIPIVIAACYGAPFRYSKSGHVIDANTKEGIDGIRVTCLENGNDWNNTYTYNSGYFEVYYDIPCDYLQFTDEDGPENGSYRNRTIEFDQDCPDLTVELTPEEQP